MISVILRSPHNGYYGGTVSGPIFREIAMKILEMNGKLPPEARGVLKQEPPAVTEGVVDIDGTLLATGSGEPRPVWDVRGLTAEQGRSLLASQGFVVLGAKPNDKSSSIALIGNASGIIEDVQKCGGDTVRFVLAKPITEDEIARAPQATVAPNLVGMPMARAIKLASADGFRVKTSGSGAVTKQFPDPGSALRDVRSILTEAIGSPTITLFGEEQ